MSQQGSSRNPAEPAPQRPDMPPNYGIERGAEGMLSWGTVADQLVAAHNYWVCTTRPDGRPHAAPVWGLWLDGAVCFATDPASRKGRNLAANPEVVVHLESGDDAVILEGAAEQVTDRTALARFADDYHTKYGFRPDVDDPAALVYAVRPRTAYAWRERDFLTSATRWRLRGT